MLALLAALATNAAAVTLTVGPPDERISVAPGGTTTFQVTVANTAKDPAEKLVTTAYVQDWWYNPDGSHVFAAAGTLTHSASAWMSITPPERMMAGGQTDTFDVTVSAPKDAKAGAYAVVFVEGHTPEHPLMPGGRIGVLVMVRVSGTGRDALTLEHSSVEPPTETTPLELDLTVHDTGDVHEFAEFHGVLIDASGKSAASLSAPPLRFLPDQTRHIRAKYSGVLSPGAYTVVGTVQYAGDHAIAVSARVTVAP